MHLWPPDGGVRESKPVFVMATAPLVPLLKMCVCVYVCNVSLCPPPFELDSLMRYRGGIRRLANVVCSAHIGDE